MTDLTWSEEATEREAMWDSTEEEIDGPGPLFDGDSGQLALAVRRTFVALLKKRYISSERHPHDWRVVIENQSLLESRFNDLFLQLVVDGEYEVAYKRQAIPEGGRVFPTVIHDIAYSREETILMVHLRGIFRSRRASGDDAVFVDRDDLVEEVANFRPANATNHVRDEKAARNAVDAIYRSDILLKTSELDRYRVSPIIEVLLPVSQVQELISWLINEQGGDRTIGAPDDDREFEEEVEQT